MVHFCGQQQSCMKQHIRILIVDDHPMTVKGYELLLRSLNLPYTLAIDGAANCDEVLAKMDTARDNFYDIVFLDIGVPASSDKSVVNGEDLGQRIRKKFGRTKIVVHTALNDQARIDTIFRSLQPEGFVIKSDLDAEMLKDLIDIIWQGHTYYSERTNKLIGKGNHHKAFLDSSDQKILYLLSKGFLMKDLPKHVPLSMATIERRKKNLKILFGIPDGTTNELLELAKIKGFI